MNPHRGSTVRTRLQIAGACLALLVCAGTLARPALAQAPAPAQQSTLFLPLVRSGFSFAPRTVAAVPVAGPPVDRPAERNADLNLGLRGSLPVQAALTLIDIGGPSDEDAPQLAALFAPPRVPSFVAAGQVHDWNWSCGPNGCQGAPLAAPPVTLLEVATAAGEFIYLPSRRAPILDGGFVALLLYAEARRLTLKYTREDSPVFGYMVHIEGLEVDPALVARYRELDAAGRAFLPGLRNGDLLGRSAGRLRVAVRDTGSFMDPRTRKDWWKGY